jgi:Tfp pilus assembly protein PilP
MQNKFIILAMLITLPSLAFAGDRDPFAPYASAKNSIPTAKKADNDSTVTPLTEDSLSAYKLVGLIVSPTDSIVLIRSSSNREYFASIGDKIGNEGGIIHKISTEGMTVDINGRIVDLTVNNRLEIQNEAN